MELINTCFALADEVRGLAYYSHLLPIIISLLLGVVVMLYAKNKNKAILFFSFVVLLSLWLAGDLVVWATNDYYLVAAFWSYLDFVNILFYLFILYFLLVDVGASRKIQISAMVVGFLASLPPFIITLSGLAVHEFDQPNCEMIGNDWLALYKLGFEWTVIGVIVLVTIVSLIKRWKNKTDFKRILLTTISTTGFLAIFSGSEFVATYTDVYEINLYALFTLPVFILLLTISIFEFKTFKMNVDSISVVRVLFSIFVIITVINLFFIDDTGEFIISGTGAAITLGFGLLVLRGASREAKQRQEIESLAKRLKLANDRLKVLDKQKSEFVSIASHQLRSPLTAISGYASLLLEESYGKIPAKAKEPVERIYTSARAMAQSVEEYLNVSRIESGNMKYEKTDFNLRDEVEHICDDLRSDAVQKGLMLYFKTDLSSRAIVHADLGKVIQAVHNLINNSIKYTEKGKIAVTVCDDIKKKRIYVEVEDTGIGMSEETLNSIFQKFERADNAHKVNIKGTGLGLYMALKLIEAMKGTITAYSDGEGKGSKFVLELPLVM
ncbi:MAG: HAMP domain-containing sensor histidine kinase [Candidatus Paceibacterota bacterium]